MCADDGNVQLLVESVLEGVQSQCHAEESGGQMRGECQLRWGGEEGVLGRAEEAEQERLNGRLRGRALGHGEVIANRLPREEGLLQLARQGGVGEDEPRKDVDHLRIIQNAKSHIVHQHLAVPVDPLRKGRNDVLAEQDLLANGLRIVADHRQHPAAHTVARLGVLDHRRQIPHRGEGDLLIHQLNGRRTHHANCSQQRTRSVDGIPVFGEECTQQIVAVLPYDRDA